MSTSEYTTKVCTLCGAAKPTTLEYFARDKRGKFGLQARCRVCHNRVVRDIGHRPEKREKERFRKRSEKYKKYRREYRKRKGGKTESEKQYYRDWARTWRKKNPERSRLIGRVNMLKRRALILQNGGEFTKEDILLQYRSQHGKCWWCTKRVGGKYHVDHVRPLARGGTNNPNNLVISCPDCNLAKNDKLPHEWIGRLF